jgi:hypothetical protein
MENSRNSQIRSLNILPKNGRNATLSLRKCYEIYAEKLWVKQFVRKYCKNSTVTKIPQKNCKKAVELADLLDVGTDLI